MSSRVDELQERGLINPPRFFKNNIQYEAVVGSVSYGVSDDTSDMDVYGFVIPNKDIIFPHLRGEIIGFGRQIQKFEQWEKHHIKDPDALGGKGRDYDITIFNIVKFFQLCMNNNPNMVDCLFVPDSYILHSTKVGNIVRENRKIFLHKGCWHRFKGYAYSQLKKMKSHKRENPKRQESLDKFGIDVKFAYHVYRLLGEVEQILESGDLDLQRDREVLKSIRRGEWEEEKLRSYFNEKEKSLEKLYEESKLQYSPDENKIKALLLNCLEEHFGSLDKCITLPDRYKQALIDIQEILDRSLRDIEIPISEIVED